MTRPATDGANLDGRDSIGRELARFAAHTLFLWCALVLGGLVHVAPEPVRGWVPATLWCAWISTRRATRVGQRVIDLSIGALLIVSVSSLLKLDLSLLDTARGAAVALAYVIAVAPAIDAAARRAPLAVGAAAALAVTTIGTFSLTENGVFERTPDPAPRGAPNLLLISIDTTRVDSLGCYGAHWNRSPTLDSIAADGAIFGAAIAQAPHTHSSMASLLTSRYPIEHGSLRLYHHLDERNLTLAELMRGFGYRTAAFLDNPWLTREFGFDQGYDAFVESADVGDVVKWIQDAPDAPFFLHVHLLHPHGPYDAVSPYINQFDPDYPADGPYQDVVPIEDLWDARENAEAGFSDRAIARFRSLQASEIRGMDDEIEQYLRVLEARGVESNTLVVVVADHGEEFQEHASVGHAHTLYEELIHVPLLMRFPGVVPPRTRVDVQVELIDVIPTALELLGLPVPEGLPGDSHASHVTGRAVPPSTANVAISQLYELRGRQLVALRTPRWKLIVSLARQRGADRRDVSFEFARPEDLIWGKDLQLFDLVEDPAEARDRSSQHPEIVDELLETLVRWRSEQTIAD